MKKNRKEDRPTVRHNAFLSRIFNLQSEGLASSLNEVTDPYGLRNVDPLFNPQTHVETEYEELRVPKSDQETTSDDDEGEEGSLYAYDGGIQNPLLSTTPPNKIKTLQGQDGSIERAELKSEYSSLGPLQKLGQLSSDEDSNESNSNSNGNGNNNYTNTGGDSPLFTGSKEVENGRDDRNVDIRYSLLFQRIMNRYPREPRPLLTSQYNRTDGPSDPNHSRKDWHYLEDGRNDFKKSSHINMRKHTLTSNSIPNLRDRLPWNRPDWIPSIAVLNRTPPDKLYTLSPKERALWKWANIENLDAFLQDTYQYYLGNGFQCILLQKILNLLRLIFVVFISLFTGYCIDYSKLPQSTTLSEIRVEHCYKNNISGVTKFVLWIFYLFVALKVVQLYFDYMSLKETRNFYKYLLGISDNELQTIPWQNIIRQLMLLKDQNALTANVSEVKAKNRIDAHDVANRIMRKDNYLIALYNSDILDLSLDFIPFRTNALTKTLEWNINLCIIGFVFNDAGFIKQSFLKESQRELVCEDLKKRFMLAGFLNIILSPFLVTYFILLNFLKYFNEYKNSPGSLSARQYTAMAEWKMREYNELYHIFRKRLGLSIPLANKYIRQFPNEKINTIMKFLAFISGSFLAILITLTLFDPENSLNFEITPNRTTLFYITLLGTVWTVCHGAISQEYYVYDPEETVIELAKFTHYLPREWRGRYHTEEVKHEFCQLFSLKIVILFKELASIVITPFILWFSLPKSAGKIVDFFRETSVYVDGLGYVCKYAMFQVEKETTTKNSKKAGLPGTGRLPLHREQSPRQDIEGNLAEESDLNSDEEDSDRAKNAAAEKMLQSYMYFIEDYENSDNMTGKYQLPKARIGESLSVNKVSNKSYTWQKQFHPGNRPELFKIGQRNDKRMPFPRDNVVGEDFLGVGAPTRDQTSDPRVTDEPSTQAHLDNNRYRRGAGMLNVMTDYYRKPM